MKLSDKIRVFGLLLAALVVVAGISATLYTHMSIAGATFWTGVAIGIVVIFLVAATERIER